MTQARRELGFTVGVRQDLVTDQMWCIREREIMGGPKAGA